MKLKLFEAYRPFETIADYIEACVKNEYEAVNITEQCMIARIQGCNACIERLNEELKESTNFNEVSDETKTFWKIIEKYGIKYSLSDIFEMADEHERMFIKIYREKLGRQ